jgi:hypothetical protein
MDVHDIPLEEIRPDFFFRFTTDKDLSRLERSIRASGIRNPLWILERENGRTLLSGFRRFLCAQKLSFSVVPAYILAGEKNSLTAFSDVLLEHLSIHSLNLVEKARIIRILEHLGKEGDSLNRFCFQVLELPCDTNPLESVRRILDLHPRVQEFIARYDLSLRQVEPFFRFLDEDQERLIALAGSLGVRSVELGKIMDDLEDLVHTGKKNIKAILEDLGAGELIGNPQWTRQQKLAKLKSRIQERKAPRRVAWNRELEKILHALKLPPGVQTEWDLSLERPGVRITACLETPESVQALASALDSPEARESWKRIFRIV